MKRALLIVPPAGLLALGLTFVLLEHTQAYRSPLSGSEPPSPRVAALDELAAWRQAKAAEEARLQELLANLDGEKMVTLGKGIVHGRGLCFNCHRVGAAGDGSQGPDLDGVGARAKTSIPGMTDIEYLTQSVYEPRAFIVEGYPSVMTPVNEAPMSLSELDILMVVAYLQSLGSDPTVTPETELAH